MRRVKRVLVVIARAEDHLDHKADAGDDQRGQQGVAEPTHVESARDHVACDTQSQGVGEKDEDEPDAHHVGQPQRGEDRRKDRVHERDRERDAERSAGTADRDGWQDRRRDPDRDGGNQPRQQQVERADARLRRLPSDHFPVRTRLAHSG
jgi:hypothetical protein